MARRKNPVPTYTRHSSGCARARWTDAAGIRHERKLPGAHDSAESRSAYARLLLEIETAPHRVNNPNPAGITVNALLDAYRTYAEQHYRGPDGASTGETERIGAAARHVRELYGMTPAASFGPLALKAVRQRFIHAGWCRRSINQQIERVRRIYKWAASEQLVSAAVYLELTTVTGLQRGRTAAHEREPVGPVDDAVVDATLPYLNRHVRGLIEFQRLTGCRPGEACMIRRCDIDTGGAIWQYRPPHHKNTWRGKTRIIAIGPKAQQLIREFFTPNIEDYLFSPRRAMDEIRAERAAKRKSPRWPSHEKRYAAKRKARPKRAPHERYTSRSYFYAVGRAVMKAKLQRWHPNQLRHSHGTKVRKEFSLEHAGAVLGHAELKTSQIYAERDAGLALEVAAKIG